MYDLILITGFTKNLGPGTITVGGIYNKLKDRIKIKILVPDRIVNFDHNDIIPEARYYGISPYFPDWYHAIKTMRVIKSKYPKSKIIVGGTFATSFPDVILQCKEVDYVCLGEGVFTMEKIFSGEDLETISNIQTRNKMGILNLKEVADCSNLIRTKEDFIGPISKDPIVTELIFTSRGCPFDCSFCSSPGSDFTSKIVYANMQAVESDIEYISKSSEYPELCLSSPNAWIPSKKSDAFVRNVFDLFKKYKVKDSVILLLMKGDYMLKEEFKKLIDDYPMLRFGFFIGIENFDDRLLSNFNKSSSSKEVYYNCFKEFSARDNVEYIGGNILVGCPGETEETIKINKEWINKIGSEITYKYPHKKLFVRAEKFLFLPGSKYHYEIEKYSDYFVDEYPFLYDEDPINNPVSVLGIKRDHYELIKKREQDLTDFCHNVFG